MAPSRSYDVCLDDVVIFHGSMRTCEKVYYAIEKVFSLPCFKDVKVPVLHISFSF
ncbi:hypothetical protein [Sigmofec virus UA08Rod_5667]|uniref:Uncharacterized protein n=1 Tax=Sigmofec virus UA08Rod_5667 TaxID=2929435 RepID=A0A976N0L5_9VIRU|nr:hypothetical protein [Sigmofec virus UA08Rod_5667]